MKFELPPLPYAKDALEPHLSTRTLEFHYEKHHRGYLDKLRSAVEGTADEVKTLEELVVGSSGRVFENAAQVWNHTFYWNSMKPGGGGTPEGDLGEALVAGFGSYDAFRSAFLEQAGGLFGSGYVWLSVDRNDRLTIDATRNAANPLCEWRAPLLGMDVWEHAYYLDYQNARIGYAEAFLDHLANWSFAVDNWNKRFEAWR